MTGAEPETFKVGRLAELLDLTVRTLHHYDSLGLVVPSGRTGSGHRVYSASDVERLYQVVALRQLGLPLDVVATVLSGASTLAEILEAHQQHLEQKLELLRGTRDQVAVLRAGLERLQPPETGDFLELIRKVVMEDQTVRKYFDAEQLADLEQRRQSDPDAATRAQQGWAELLPEVDAAIEQGTEPTSAAGQALARRWDELLAQFHAGDEGLRQGLVQLQAENADVIREQHGGPTEAQIAFVTAAHAG